MDCNEKEDGIGQHDHQKQPNGTSHHDTHAIPPQFVQDAYVYYNKVKIADLDKDSNVVDFGRGLTADQEKVLIVVGTIKASTVEAACRTFTRCGRDEDSDKNPSITDDVLVYEHQDFPGLQIAPGILSPEAQIKFVSRILHDHLADPKHKTNLQNDYDIEYPSKPSSSSPSLFKYLPTNTHSTPKTPTTTQPQNMIQLLSKKLRWLTIGTQYDWPTRSYPPPSSTQTPFPPDIANLVTTLFPHIKPESGVCLLYGSKDYMPVHRDVSEQCQTALASFSFGCDGIFLVARADEGEYEEEGDDGDDEEEEKKKKKKKKKKKRTVAIRIRSGDCVHMTGQCRWAWHAMPRTITGTCPDYLAGWPVGSCVGGSFDDNGGSGMSREATKEEIKIFEKWKGFMKGKRLNVSCRQVWG